MQYAQNSGPVGHHASAPYPRNTEAETSPSGRGLGEDGKKRSRLNALRHGITGRVATIMVTFNVLATGSTCGRQLAQRIATDSWRLNRLGAVEDNLFALGLHEHGGKLSDHEQIDAALTTAQVFAMESKQLQLLTLYERRLNRAIDRQQRLQPAATTDFTHYKPRRFQTQAA